MASLLFCMYADSAAAENRIIWAVENRFRLFDYLNHQSPEKSAELLAKYAAAGSLKKETVLIAYDKLAKLGSPFVTVKNNERRINPGPWRQDEQQYADEYAKTDRQRHRISFYLETPGEGRCRWSLMGRLLKEMSCSETLTVDDMPSQFEVAVEIDGIGGNSLTGRIREHRILAVGDSYASGEGNPDAPTIWEKDKVFDGGKDSLENMMSPALWWDERCHRSFWSNQMFAALSFSLADPHSVVTFMQFSCSGAEVFDGLLMPQSEPPGKDNYLPEDGCDDSRMQCGHERYSQLSAAALNLCEHVQNDDLGVTEPGEPWTEKLGKGDEVFGLRCSGAPQIDTLLLSIGGNDVQFSQVVKWALIPAHTNSRSMLLDGPFNYLRKKSTTCPSNDSAKHQETYGACDPPPSQRLAEKRLPEFYNALDKSLKRQLALTDSKKVFITAYPDPLHDEKGKVCDSTGAYQSNWRKKNRASVQAGWDAISYFLPGFIKSRDWEFNLTPGEAGQVSGPVINTLNRTLSARAYDLGWQVVDGHLREYLNHGWCAMRQDVETIADFIMAGIPRDRYTGISPWLWEPYKSRGRWLRTINDALLTQWTDQSDGGPGGSFHPTAEGHYETGRAVFRKMKGEPLHALMQ